MTSGLFLVRPAFYENTVSVGYRLGRHLQVSTLTAVEATLLSENQVRVDVLSLLRRSDTVVQKKLM